MDELMQNLLQRHQPGAVDIWGCSMWIINDCPHPCLLAPMQDDGRADAELALQRHQRSAGHAPLCAQDGEHTGIKHVEACKQAPVLESQLWMLASIPAVLRLRNNL